MEQPQDTLFQLVAGHAVLDFVNTLDNRFAPAGPVDLLNSYQDLLRFCVQAGLLTPNQAQSLRAATTKSAAERKLRAARAARELMSEIFYGILQARPPNLSGLNWAVGASLIHRRVEFAAGVFRWTWDGVEGNADAPLWMLVYEAASLLTSEDVARLRACNSPTCQWLFLDTSKNHSRRWCDMKVCGNRTKARRHYQRAAERSV